MHPLVAVAHGSRDPAAAAVTRGLLSEVRRQRPGLDVRESYLDHAQPRLVDVLVDIDRPSVVVPLLLGDAYHSGVDIPGAIEAAGGRSAQAAVLGPDPLLLTALERRTAEAGVAPGDPGTAVVLAAAGSADPAAVAGVRDLARLWRARGWWAVEEAFASSAAPSVAAAVAALRGRGAPRVVVATYLLFPGHFAERLAAAGADVTSAVLGDSPEVATLVLARYDAATNLGAT